MLNIRKSTNTVADNRNSTQQYSALKHLLSQHISLLDTVRRQKRIYLSFVPVSEMTHTVSSGTLNSTILYYTILYYTFLCFYLHVSSKAQISEWFKFSRRIGSSCRQEDNMILLFVVQSKQDCGDNTLWRSLSSIFLRHLERLDCNNILLLFFSCYAPKDARTEITDWLGEWWSCRRGSQIHRQQDKTATRSTTKLQQVKYSTGRP